MVVGNLKGKILVVDDEKTVHESCSRVLREEGFEVDSALTGKAGLVKLRENLYDLVLLDIKMADSSFLKVAVSDSGTGIGPDDISKIFEPFFTTKDSGQGTGLGLAIASKILQDHGGMIEVESEPGEGTTFTLKLPVGQSNRA